MRYPVAPPDTFWHDDGILFAWILTWAIIGVPIYLFGHGLAPLPKPGLTILGGPAVWFIALYKATHLRWIRKEAAQKLKKQQEWLSPWQR